MTTVTCLHQNIFNNASLFMTILILKPRIKICCSCSRWVKHLSVRDTRLCIVLCDPGRGVTLLSHVTRDTHPRHISIFSYFPLRPARAWCLTTGRAICRGNTAPRLRLLCRLTTTITSIMQEKFHFPPLFHVTDFTPYTLNIHNSEQCPGGATLPHASPPHALARSSREK